jgi:hypothetical protein
MFQDESLVAFTVKFPIPGEKSKKNITGKTGDLFAPAGNEPFFQMYVIK